MSSEPLLLVQFEPVQNLYTCTPIIDRKPRHDLEAHYTSFHKAKGFIDDYMLNPFCAMFAVECSKAQASLWYGD